MSEQTKRVETTAEVLEEAIKHSFLMLDDRENLRERHDVARGWEEAELLEEINSGPTFEEWVDEMSPEERRAALRRRKAFAYIIAVTSFPVAIAGLYAVGEYGYYGIAWFVLSGLCLLVAKWVDKS